MNPVLPPPLDRPGVVRVMLGQAASDALKGLGKHLLILAAPADSTTPAEAQGRMVLHCMPITKERADAAYAVATGKMRAVTPRNHPPKHP